jgi:3-deoxy-D-manno-octulosonic-acid transferase
MRFLYTFLLYLLTPLLLLRLAWRGFALHDYWHRWGERFGFVARATQPVEAWVHAVSVGESLAAMPLIRSLVKRHGRGRVLVTTTTPTGSARVRAALGDEVLHTYAPYDLPDVVARFVSRMQPRRVVVMETELWPNLFHALVARDIPLVIANARLSPRSFAGYSRVRGFAARTLACCTHVAAQSEADAQRFVALGASPERVSVMGNIKFDVAIPPGPGTRDSGLGKTRFVWVAASTHEGEEEQVLQAHAAVLKQDTHALLVLVPRHPQRFDAVAKLIQRHGHPLVRRSAFSSPESRVPSPGGIPSPVLLGDSMGEMFLYFGMADAAFVGGSLVPVGGHNVLEPAAIGLPVLFGAHMHNFVAAADLLLGAKAAVQVHDASALATQVGALLRDPAKRAAMGEAGSAAVSANRGALARLEKILDAT